MTIRILSGEREVPSHVLLGRRDVLVGLALVAACGDAGGASREAKAPYPPLGPSLTNDYVRTLPDGSAARYVTARVGEKMLPGGTFGRWRMERAQGALTYAELWADPKGADSLVLAGAEYRSDTASRLSLPSTASFTLDTPVTVDLAAPVGVPQRVALSGTASIGGMSLTASAQGTYTIVARDVTVDTPAGPASGCLEVRLDGAVPLLFGAMEVSTGGTIWYSKALGVVKAQLDAPFSGLSAGIRGSRGWHDLGDGFASVEAVQILGAEKTPERFQLASSDVGHTADKRVHAKLLLELRWAEEAAAKREARPNVREELGTGFGYFPATLTRSSVSFLHPEENGRGYVYWIAYADQAAKNEPGDDSTTYVATVQYDGSGGPLRVSSRIVYKRLTR
jgi:hypothetical protein